MARQLAKALWRLTLLGQTVHHAAGTKDVTVDGRNRRRDHHDIEDGRRRADAQVVENLHERAALATDLLPWVDRHQYEQGQHIEQQNPQGNGVDRLWQQL